LNVHCLAIIMKITGGFLLLGDVWTAFAKRDLEAFYIYLFVIIPSVVGILVLLFSEVDRFAGFWGVHTWWKLVIAAIIFALFLPIIMTGARHIASKSKMKFLVIYMIVIFSLALYFVVSDWAKLPASTDLLPEARQVFPWLAIHPSLAIHHLYANATLLGALEVLWLAPIFGKSLATRMGHVLGNQRRVVTINSVNFVAGWILDIISS